MNALNSVAYPYRHIAFVFDFDGTLAPGSMQDHTIFPQLGIKPKDFWSEVHAFRDEHQCVEILAYMHLMQQRMLKQKGVNWLQFMQESAEEIPLFSGVETLFDRLRSLVDRESKGFVKAKFYVLSSGLSEILQGIPLIQANAKIFASSYIWENNSPAAIGRAITDASKPQYIFRINKGKENYNQTINDHMPEKERAIPFGNIVFIGDGETDVPCMTVTRKNDGFSLGVFDPKKPESESKCRDLYKANRINFYGPADYRQGSLTSRHLNTIVKYQLSKIRLAWRTHNFENERNL